MKSLRLTLWVPLFFSLSGHAAAYQDDLQPPDVDIYAELQGVRSDFSDFGADKQDGWRGRIGLELNDSNLGRWKWRIEGGLNQFGEADQEYSSTTSGGSSPGVFSTTRTTNESTRINGFEFGARLYDGEMFYLRTGAMIYSQKTNRDIMITERDFTGAIINTPYKLTPDSDSKSGFAPYAGMGIEFPFIDKSAKVLLEYNYYLIDTTKLDNLAVGFQFRF